jgi:2-polyprenyl-6-methoxyphenol hydroxylase-like FAD-dependent oxidoreductase
LIIESWGFFMTEPRALVSGASIAGLSTAFWLARAGWNVTVLERFGEFRTGGQNVDVRGAARGVLTWMGLEEQVRANSTTEQGTSIVADAGRVISAFPVEEADGPTAELEILRGDLARVILEALPDRVELRFGDWVEQVTDRPDEVGIELHSGGIEDYDLFVIAEGVRSQSRDKVFGTAVARRELGLNMAYGTIPRTADDDRWWRWFVTTKGRQVTLRPDNVGTTRATLAFTSTTQNLADLDLDQARVALRSVFAGGGWQTRRVVEGFSTSDDVYVDYLTQIIMPAWSKGRVCVTGDAAWCVTPLGGGGASLALTGGYVLAAFLSQHGPAGLDQALTDYEQWMRPLVQDSQQLPPGTPALFYPQSRVGVTVWRTVARLAGLGPFRKLASRLSHVAQTDQQFPEFHA